MRSGLVATVLALVGVASPTPAEPPGAACQDRAGAVAGHPE
jgi:hypothetical protein